MNPIKHDKSHCVVPQCCTTACKYPEISFFRFPRASSCKTRNDYKEWNQRKLRKRDEWIRVLKIEKHISNRSVVCSKHFKESDFTKTAMKNRRLKENAVPSLCLPHSSTENADKQLKKQSNVKEIKNRYFTLSRKCENAVKGKQPVKMILCNGILRPVEESFENQEQFNNEIISGRTRETADILLQLSDVDQKQFNKEETANILLQNEVNKDSDADEIYQSAIPSSKSDKQNHKDEAGSSFATDDNSNDEIIVNTGHNKRKRKQNNSLSPKKVMNETEKSTSEISYDREDIFGQYVAGEMRALRDNPLLYLQTKQSILEILTSANFELINPE